MVCETTVEAIDIESLSAEHRKAADLLKCRDDAGQERLCVPIWTDAKASCQRSKALPPNFSISLKIDLR